jgi:hypothetical protein
VRSRLVVVQIQTYHQTNTPRKVFLGALDFFLSLRKKRQNKNRFFTRDLGSVLPYFEGKKGGVLERKNNNKNPSSSL